MTNTTFGLQDIVGQLIRLPDGYGQIMSVSAYTTRIYIHLLTLRGKTELLLDSNSYLTIGDDGVWDVHDVAYSW